MKILMVTNTFAPHVGGVARSVERFTAEYRALGHEVVVLAPGEPSGEYNVLRIPALGGFSTFSLPFTWPVGKTIDALTAWMVPDIIHAHHPFLLGDTARTLSRKFRVPLVFTHHTMYEQYGYVVGESPFVPRFLERVATEFANTCDRVFAPSQSTKKILHERGVVKEIDVIPTGVDLGFFAGGNRARARKRWGIPDDAFVVGYVGRLASEKNLGFLARAVKGLKIPAKFLVVGPGRAVFPQGTCLTGALSGEALADAYKAMDVFAFASKSETQGMVLVEAMAAGVPVVALDAPGSRDVVRDGKNGRLVDEKGFTPALESMIRWGPSLRPGALATAARYSQRACAERALGAYGRTKVGSGTLGLVLSKLLGKVV
jgi:glycosyltransferase involved in cell wall biosynthesis